MPPRPRDRDTLEVAYRTRPTRRTRAFLAYVESLPTETDSLGAIKEALCQDAGLLYDAILKRHRDA